MIFLSHNFKDKSVVEPIAVKLREVYGQANVFYDSWSIKPGENIIGKMNSGITNCKYFFFFISVNSLNSSMVDLEWQSALYKSAKEGIKFVPIKVDDCLPPQILISTLYIDMYLYGLDNTIRDIVDIIDDKDSKQYNSSFQNLICYIEKVNESELNITIKAVKLIEPNASFLFSFSNKKEDIVGKVTSDAMSLTSEGTIMGNNCLGFRVARVLTPGFPFEINLKSKSTDKIKQLTIWHQYEKENARELNIINTN